MIKLEPGWLSQQLEKATAEVRSWPEWRKDRGDIKPQSAKSNFIDTTSRHHEIKPIVDSKKLK